MDVDEIELLKRGDSVIRISCKVKDLKVEITKAWREVIGNDRA